MKPKSCLGASYAFDQLPATYGPSQSNETDYTVQWQNSKQWHFFYGVTRHLSAIVSCLASKLILLKLFHIASVSGDISRVSRNATALQQKHINGNVYLLNNNNSTATNCVNVY